MSEDEVIEIIEELQCEYREQENEKKYNDYTVFKAKKYSKGLEGLLDLYQKEKDLNQELQIRYKIENDKYKEEKEKNIKLDEKFKYAVPDEIVDELYISKDIIRKYIKENKRTYEMKTPNRNRVVYKDCVLLTKEVRELLEENNEM